MEIALWLFGSLFVLIGLLGTLILFVPGSPLIFLGAVLIAWVEDFSRVQTPTLIIVFVLMVLSQLVDYLAGPANARRAGASSAAATGAFLGGIIGIAFGLLGVLFGPLVGAVLGELYSQRSIT